jgi:vancomycin resistance protein YoaR
VVFSYLYACLLLFFPPILQDGVSNPTLHVVLEDKNWYFDLRQAGFDGVDPTTLNRQILHDWFTKVARGVDQYPHSAYYHGRKIVAHQLGKRVLMKEMDAWADLIHEYMGRELVIPYTKLQPTLTTSELKKLKRHLLAKYTTRYNPRIKNRAHNLFLATQAIDHKVIMPNETFSFNQIVGQRTISRGYKEAKIIMKGEYSEGVGGGICQTSSTLFNSVDRAGLAIIERVSHSRVVPYVPKYRDATVSWNGPDFKFVNQRKEPVLIVSEARKGNLTVRIYTSQ